MRRGLVPAMGLVAPWAPRPPSATLAGCWWPSQGTAWGQVHPRWGLEPCVPAGSPARGCQQPKSPAQESISVPGAAPGASGHAVPALRSHPDLPISQLSADHSQTQLLRWEPKVLEKKSGPKHC